MHRGVSELTGRPTGPLHDALPVGECRHAAPQGQLVRIGEDASRSALLGRDLPDVAIVVLHIAATHPSARTDNGRRLMTAQIHLDPVTHPFALSSVANSTAASGGSNSARGSACSELPEAAVMVPGPGSSLISSRIGCVPVHGLHRSLAGSQAAQEEVDVATPIVRTVPDLDLMMGVLCDARGGDRHCSQVTVRAAALALDAFGVSTEQVNIRLVVMNPAACQSLAQGTPEPGAYLATIGLAGKDRHCALRVGDYLLDLAVDEAEEPGRLTPAPMVVQLGHAFWSGQQSAFMAAEDGAGTFAWVVPGEEAHWRPDPIVDPYEVDELAQHYREAISATGHPGWTEGRGTRK